MTQTVATQTNSERVHSAEQIARMAIESAQAIAASIRKLDERRSMLHGQGLVLLSIALAGAIPIPEDLARFFDNGPAGGRQRSGGKGEPVPCAQCERTFRSKQGLATHVTRAHRG